MFDHLWRETLKHDQPAFKAADEIEAYWSLADDILRRYVTTHKESPAPLVLEFSFELPWVDPNGEEHQLCGVIDQIDESPQGLIIVDFKSGKRKPKADSIGNDLQLLLYAFAMEQVLRQPVEQVAILHLRDGALLQAVPSQEALRRLLNEVLPNVVRGHSAETICATLRLLVPLLRLQSAMRCSRPGRTYFLSRRSRNLWHHLGRNTNHNLGRTRLTLSGFLFRDFTRRSARKEVIYGLCNRNYHWHQ